MNPLQLLQMNIDAARICIEAQSVIAMRLAGAFGAWNVPANENTRMVQEKQAAAIEAGQAAFWALARGQGADRAVAASMAPIGRRTKANMKRLSRRGPGW
ncbi:antibiotic ABC transporter [Thioclava sp. BHET1]|uniref:Antifreeze protein n=1 Tax=Thioclava dalianensis TaxID=1185766 RepID=A0A074TBD4_9RHOB|nr:hypothetical protein [Thioclava dalianensis]KEP69024.1 antifreeze protein [Thioclava dalianensis]TMV94841.1 antibiotic ABC transporter [Thioclava sp. BHET1]SFM88837.1 hypothetical protein SAMN05216224_101756 [Thioclava dalianensis]